MGLFDNINDKPGQAGLLTQAKWFATLDLKSIMQEGGKAVVSILINAIAFFGNLFDKGQWSDDEKILGERMIDQIPGMAQALSASGYLDKSIGDYADRHPLTVELVSRNYGNYKYIIPMAQQLFTVLFGVPITRQGNLNDLQAGIEQYYMYSGRTDVPREAVARAVMLKQTYFPDSTYNKVFWNLNYFQQHPLVAPIPGFEFGTLYTGDIIGGGRVENGILVSGGPLVGDGVDPVDTHGNGADPLEVFKKNSLLWWVVGGAALLILADGDS